MATLQKVAPSVWRSLAACAPSFSLGTKTLKIDGVFGRQRKVGILSPGTILPGLGGAVDKELDSEKQVEVSEEKSEKTNQVI